MPSIGAIGDIFPSSFSPFPSLNTVYEHIYMPYCYLSIVISKHVSFVMCLSGTIPMFSENLKISYLSVSIFIEDKIMLNTLRLHERVGSIGVLCAKYWY